ncbi:hypothetical protein PS627_01105 [Pseudomonas fluorescens]|nr:hypothetical protein PS627_01105 [Pseudomonas fluorescens]
MFMQFGFGALLVLIGVVLLSAFRILREYERGVVFQLGRFWQVKGPGLILLIPVVQQMVRVDLRTVVLDVPTQDVITRDNVSVKVNAVVYFRVLDPQKAIIQVEDFLNATSQLAQTTLRAVLGKHELDELLAERERLNMDIRQVLDAQTDAWGIKVANVEIKHVDLNESMIRAIARQAEAERERRAKVIHAEGELQASEKLMQAAQMLGKEPGAMQLRYMQTLGSIASDKTTTIVFPVPVDLLKGLAEKWAAERGALRTPVPSQRRAADSGQQCRGTQEQAGEGAVHAPLLSGRAQQAQHTGGQARVARHHQQVDGDHGAGDGQVLGHQRCMRIDELRQHREHEDQRLGVADVHQESAKHQVQWLADRTHGRFVGDVGGQRTPLLYREVDQVRNTEPFDDLECSRGSRKYGAHACCDDGDLQDKPQLQAQGVPVTTPEAVLQPAGHRSDGPGTRRQADHPARGKKGQPGFHRHHTPRLVNIQKNIKPVRGR